jgi:hypothetical protein
VDSDEFASKSNLARYMKKNGNKAHRIKTFILENDEKIFKVNIIKKK